MLTTVLIASVLCAAKPTAAFAPKNRPYDALHYRIDFRLKDPGTFENAVTITLKPIKKPLAEIELDARSLEIGAVKVNGEEATFKQAYEPALRTGTLTIKPVKPLPPGVEAKVEVTVTGKVSSTAHEGMFTVSDPDDADAPPYYFTQFEPTYAQAFFPCNDTPDDKATSEVFAVVDGRYTVLSNGKKEKDETFTEGGKNLRRVLYKQELPHSTYLIALAVGLFEPHEVGGDTPATVWTLPGKSDRVFEAINSTRSALNFEAAYVGVKYPWVKYDQVAVPRFFWSGMENTSLVFNRESKLVLDHKNDQANRTRITGLIAHEMAHQWFGNLVTLKGWDETWLNEGFATYLGRLAEDNYDDNDMIEVQNAAYLMDSYFREEAGPRSHPLAGRGGASPEEMFDPISYQKGAMVLQMLDTWLGRAEMKKVLKAYLEKYAQQNATSDDFFSVVYATTKKEKELKPFKEAWLKKKGYPVLFTEVGYEGGSATITIRQQPVHGDEKGPFVFKLPIVLHRENEPKYVKEELVLVDKPTVTVKVDVPGPPQWINWNKNGSALARINTPSVPEEQWVDAARLDPDPVWRLAATFVLLGEMGNPEMKEETKPTDAAFNALLDVLNKDPSPYVREQVLVKLSHTAWKHLPASLGPTVFQLAKRPNLAEDALGQIKVRRAAMTLLGKIDYPDGHRYLISEVQKKDQDLNFLSALADGVAHLGTPEALATIQAAVRIHKPRGYAGYRNAAESLGSLEMPEAVKALKDLFKENAGNNEMMRNVLGRLVHNHAVRSSAELAAWVGECALDEAGYPENIRAEMLELLETSKSPETKATLTSVVDKSTSERLKNSAQHLLASNFPSAPAPAPEPAPKKKK